TDSDDRHTLWLIVPRKLGQPPSDMLHVRAMIAHENNSQSWRVLELFQRDGVAARIREAKCRRPCAQRQHCRIDRNHDENVKRSKPVVECKFATSVEPAPYRCLIAFWPGGRHNTGMQKSALLLALMFPVRPLAQIPASEASATNEASHH